MAKLHLFSLYVISHLMICLIVPPINKTNHKKKKKKNGAISWILRLWILHFNKMLNAPIDNRVPLYYEDDSSNTIYDSIPYTYFIQTLTRMVGKVA